MQVTKSRAQMGISESHECTTLDAMRPGQRFEIVSVDDEMARVQAMRFGMSEGACVECITKIPAGPLVVRSGRQEIAIGRALAKKISVRTRAGA